MVTHKKRQRTSKAIRDESVMNTNNSCIVSKRSVEKIYHRADHGLRLFVNKFQRRAPLINRGYWLRMRAIEHTIRTFLQEPAASDSGCKVVINLGCGYDVIPFKFLKEEPELCENALFIDVDYPELIQRKIAIIEASSQFVRSKRYVALGCDLADATKLNESLKIQGIGQEDRILFVAEVSMTYMAAKDADSVIHWASSFKKAQFCILEQCLPEGVDTPYARVMLKHFEKFQSPLKTVLEHPTLEHQQERFSNNGWTQSTVSTLWDLWNDDLFLPVEERIALDYVEPFDEWEEFVLFAQHYFILVASTLPAASQLTPQSLQSHGMESMPCQDMTVRYIANRGMPHGVRRHGASVALAHCILHHGGHGTQGRLNDVDMFRLVENAERIYSPPWTTANLPEVVCHTISNLEVGLLLVGGRSSPARASAACYYMEKYSRTHELVSELPIGLFRHSAVVVQVRQEDSAGEPIDGDNIGVLVFGGRTSSGEISDRWFLWEPGQELKGWTELKAFESNAKGIEASPTASLARFGAAMALCGASNGFLTGGIGPERNICSDLVEWKLMWHNGETVVVYDRIIPTSNPKLQGLFGRFGAKLISLENNHYLIGGVSRHYLHESHEILKITKDFKIIPYSLKRDGTIPRPLLIGHSVEAILERWDTPGQFIIFGGGAVCFSFGTFWNEGCWSMSVNTTTEICRPWCLQARREHTKIQAEENDDPTSVDTHQLSRDTSASSNKSTFCRRLKLEAADSFNDLLQETAPAIFEGLDVGPCVERWTLDYLVECIGGERKIIVHEAATPSMDFLSKNFTYTTMTFAELINAIQAGKCLYLRALSSTSPSSQPTTLAQDFPQIAADVVLPPQLAHVSQHMHSSPLRISGPVNMWLHYDVMANILIQIQGRRRLVLFSPLAVTGLDFPPGASSSHLQVFTTDGSVSPAVANLSPVICDLQPGDVLFIPPLWAHAAFPTDPVSVGVNVFFRSLESGYAAGRDVYGNRDLQAYENGRRDVARIEKAFKGLPGDVAYFYMKRLAREIEQAAEALNERRLAH